jgi:glycosyltransferase involved in cell wall biosynthesis
MPQLDVLVPHFNDPDGLAMSLNSIAAQEWTGDMRVIVCDDGSIEKSAERLPEILQRTGVDHLLLFNDRNQGRPATRNRLLEASEAPFVAWLDSGDIWKPGKLNTQFDTLWRAYRAGDELDRIWVTCDYDWQWSGQKPRGVVQNTSNDQARKLLIGSGLRAYLWTLLGTRQSFKAVGEFDPRLTRLQDLDFFLRFVIKGGKLIAPGSDRTYCIYNKSDIGKNAKEILGCMNLVYEKHHVLLRSYGRGFTRARRYDALMHAARFAHNNGDGVGKTVLFSRAFLQSPRRFVRHVSSKGFKP